jgi:nicotinamidase-related amidase
VAASAELISAARERGAPVIFTTMAYDAATLATAALHLRKVPGMRILTPGSRWTEVDPRLGMREDDALIAKPFASAFHATGLAALLAVARVDTLIVTGASTSGCVRATAVDGLQNGFHTIVPREAVADRDARSHEVSLSDLDGRYADVAAVADVLAYLRRDIPAPESAIG